MRQLSTWRSGCQDAMGEPATVSTTSEEEDEMVATSRVRKQIVVGGAVIAALCGATANAEVSHVS